MNRNLKTLKKCYIHFIIIIIIIIINKRYSEQDDEILKREELMEKRRKQKMKEEFVKFLEAKRNEWNEIRDERRKLRGFILFFIIIY